MRSTQTLVKICNIPIVVKQVVLFFQESSEICADNHTTCISDNIDAVKEVFDEETCLGMLVNYYQVFS